MIADAVLVVHALFVVFVVAGFALILLGARGWSWVRNRTFRILHLAAIAFVAAEALVGLTCPLTTWEDALRGAGTERSFVGRWVARLLYYDLPERVFTIAYCVFALAVIWAWFVIPPHPSRRNNAL